MAAATTARGSSAGTISSLQALRILTRVQLDGMRGMLGARGVSLGMLLMTMSRTAILGIFAIVVSLGTAAFYALLLPAYIPGLAVTAASLLGLFFTFSDAAGSIFGFRDYDHVMSLPISTRVVIVSRVGALYIKQLMWSAVVMVPMYVLYFLTTPVSAAGVVTAIVTVLLTAAVPVSVSVLVAFLLAAFSSHFKYAGAVYIVFGILGTLALIIVSMSFGNASELKHNISMDAFDAGMRAIASFYPMAALAVAAGMGGWIKLLVFAAVSVVVVALTVEVLARTFMGINALLSAGSAAGPAARNRRERASSPIWAMAVKDLKMMLNLPQLAMNSLFGGVLLLVFGLVTLVMGHDAAASAVVTGYMNMDGSLATTVIAALDVIVPWVFAFCLGTANLTAILVSMEGSSAWIMATAPIPVRDLLAAKVLASLLLAVPEALICAVCMVIGGYPMASAVCGLVLGVASAVFMAAFGQHIDVRRPNYTWTAPAEVVKRSRSVTVSSILSVVIVAVGVIASFMLSMNVGDAPAYACSIAVAAVELIVAWVCFNRSAKDPLYLNR